MPLTSPTDRAPLCIRTRIDSHCAELLQSRFAPADLETVLRETAQAITASPGWGDQPPLGVAVRRSPSPLIGLFGHWSEDELRLVRLQAAAVPGVLERLRVVGYSEAEALAQRLAASLGSELGPALAGARFVAIPRGGHVVLAYLSYLLHLTPEQLLPGSPDEGAPLVVVDDCAITGARFRQFLSRPVATGAPRVVFAHLLSHPGLRVTIRREEPRVVACIAGDDLTDLGPERHGDGYLAWRERWMERAGPRRYWVGITEHLCFPWAEPGRTVWDEACGEARRGWWLAPASRCLARRADVPPAPVQVLSPGSEGLAPGPEVLWFDQGERVLVAGEERVVALGDAAAHMWRALLATGDAGSALERLRAVYPDAGAALEADLQALIGRLLKLRLLVEAPGAAQ